MRLRLPFPLPPLRDLPAISRWRQWWRRQAPHRQDRYAVLAPLAAVMMFLAAIVAVFAYLRFEEIDREYEALHHDVEYAQQHLRLRLLERQEHLMRLARELSNREINAEQFRTRAKAMISQYPELHRLSWLDPHKHIKASVSASQFKPNNESAMPAETQNAFKLAQELEQPVYAQRSADLDNLPLLELHIPLSRGDGFGGMLLAEYSVDSLHRYGIPAEVSARYAFSLHDAHGKVLAGTPPPKRHAAGGLLPWAKAANEFEAPVSPVGNGLVIRARAYRTSLGVIGSGLFWLVCALSLMTAWMLIGNWRHTRRRMQAQQALVVETNFRRAMENSMPTGMRALDLQGRITYVNAAFCNMTGWSEAELVGCTAPFPYWPDEDRETLAARLEDELSGRVTPGGFQVRVKRKDNSIFDARIYLSPLIDAHGMQTGWMTSMTDITEPNRVRDQLYASYERFTTVLDALDASVSVAPLGTDEVLFANKMYRLWFHEQTSGHVRMAALTSLPGRLSGQDARDSVDSFVGMPINTLPEVETENTEIFVEELGKWLEVRTRYLTWVDGRLAQMVIATDITPRVQAEEQAAAQAERAQTASRLITMGEMASSVAHELNQPLTAINNYCTGMVSRIKAHQITEPDLLNALEKTAKQAQRAGQIIQRIRSFVKRSEPNWTLSEIGVMVDEAVELAEIELRRFNVRLTHKVADALPPLLVDPILIEQVLVNLLKNAAESVVQARRHGDNRRVELYVVPTTADDRPVVEFSVLDTGKGIAPEVMERLYEAFYTTKAEGMGIGLSLCRSIVESHKGRMKAENLYNGPEVSGCRFSFWIPLTDTALSAPRPEHREDAIPG